MAHPESNTDHTESKEITLQCDKVRKQKNLLLPKKISGRSSHIGRSGTQHYKQISKGHKKECNIIHKATLIQQ
jgi:hypothetical protein